MSHLSDIEIFTTGEGADWRLTINLGDGAQLDLDYADTFRLIARIMEQRIDEVQRRQLADEERFRDWK